MEPKHSYDIIDTLMVWQRSKIWYQRNSKNKNGLIHEIFKYNRFIVDNKGCV